MKISQRMLVAGLMGGAIFFAGSARADGDTELCRGGYRTMLMTQGECGDFMRQMRTAESTGDRMKVFELEVWHTELLIERSQACPCEMPSNSQHLANYGQPRLLPSGKR